MNCQAKEQFRKIYLRDDTTKKLEKMISDSDIQNRLKQHTPHSK